MTPDRRLINRLAGRKYFVVTRAQLTEIGVSVKWIRRQVDTGLWRRAYPGVYITHTGHLAWMTRMTAALAYAGHGAALSHSTAVDWWFETESTRERHISNLIELSVPAERRLVRRAGLRLHRRRVMPPCWSGILTVTEPEETVVDQLRRLEKVDDVVGLLTKATRTLDPVDIRRALAGRARVRHRALAADILAVVAEGVESPLEFRYHRDVESAHGLPRSELQLRERLEGSWIRADCRYRAFRVRVELDGHLAHPGGRTARDTWRDNAALLETSELTLRYRWSHVVGDPCRTAAQVSVALRKGGWQGRVTRCGPTCQI